MPNNQSTNSHLGLGFLEFLALIFITLKLSGYIDWSWWWVLAPLWGQIVIFVIAFIVIIIYAVGKESPSGGKRH